MNKMIKGSVAGATGIALLMGGFGTYALWSDSEGLNSGSVQSGTLSIVSVGDATWKDVSTGAANTDWQANYKMVPGDTVTMTRAVNIDAKGKNLAVDFELSGLPTQKHWGDKLTVSATYDGQALTGGADTNGYTFTKNAAKPADLDGSKDLVVTFAFDASTSATAQQNQSLSLTGLNLSVTQTR